MEINASHFDLDLKQGEGVAVKVGGWARVVCEEGDLWVTTADSPNDTVLASGQAIIVQDGAWVSALSPSRAHLDVHADELSSRNWFGKVREGTLRLFGPSADAGLVHASRG